jgi:lipopolysaccharide biosynthesis protein
MRRVAVFAHYDPQNSIKRYILRHLTALREVCDEIHFATTAQLAPEELAKLDGLVASHRVCENAGYDFGMWAQTIRALDLRDWDELVLTNSSVFGPLTSLAQTFQSMEGTPCDFWGMTDSLEIEYHIQSFFIVFRNAVLKSGQVQAFFASVLPYRHKWQVIRSYELGLTHFMLDQGFVPGVVASVQDPALRLGVCNPCIWAPVALTKLGVPYVKVELMRDNPANVWLAPVRARMATLGYPLELVEVERRPPVRVLRSLWNRFNLLLQRWHIRGKPIMPLRPCVSAMFQARLAARAQGQTSSAGLPRKTDSTTS